MKRKIYKDQQGFTVTELLIATAVFSLLLVGILASFIKISDLFYKGVTMSKTQADARNIVQSISDDIQFTPSVINNVYADHNQFTINTVGQTFINQKGSFCVGNHRYSFQIGAQVDSVTDGLVRDNVGAGTCPQVGTLPGQTSIDPLTKLQMLDYGMQLNRLSVNCQANRCGVKIYVVYYGGIATGLFYSPCSPTNTCFGGVGYAANPEVAPDALCIGSIESADLCATVDYDSTVLENTP